jgi:probable HAF family extracellular repeat protein
LDARRLLKSRRRPLAGRAAGLCEANVRIQTKDEVMPRLPQRKLHCPRMMRWRQVDRPRLVIAIFVSAQLTLSTVCSAVTYSVIDLGTLSGSASHGYGINLSGEAVGDSYITSDAAYHALRFDGTIQDLGTLGGTNSSAKAINASGQIAGYSDLAGGATHAFLYGSMMTDLSTLGGANSYAYGINASGHVVGDSETSLMDPTGAVTTHAFFYDGATMRDVGTLAGGYFSFATGINSTDRVVGYAYLPGEYIYHAFYYDTRIHDIGTLGGSQSDARAINNSGQIVGAADTDGDFTSHAFLYDGTMHDLGTLGGVGSEAWSINTSGEIAGSSYLTDNVTSHAFLYTTANGMVDLNSLVDPQSPWVLQRASAINDLGQMVGFGTIGGQTHGFLLSLSELKGDFNSDGRVNVADLQSMMTALQDLRGYQSLHELTPSQLVQLGDFSNDGMVSNLDVQGLIDYLANGNGSGTLSAVPEPASAWLLLVSLLAIRTEAARRLPFGSGKA